MLASTTWPELRGRSTATSHAVATHRRTPHRVVVHYTAPSEKIVRSLKRARKPGAGDHQKLNCGKSSAFDMAAACCGLAPQSRCLNRAASPHSSEHTASLRVCSAQKEDWAGWAQRACAVFDESERCAGATPKAPRYACSRDRSCGTTVARGRHV